MQQNFDPQKEMQVRMQKLLTQNYFPVERISEVAPMWEKFAFAALHHTSIMELGASPEDLRLINNFFKPNCDGSWNAISLHHFAIVSNNLQRKTPSQLGTCIEEYAQVMAEADELVKIWQAEVKPLQEQMEKDFEEEVMQRAVEAKNKKHGLQPVKGEA